MTACFFPTTYVYGFLMAIAFILGLWLFWINRHGNGISDGRLIDIALILVFTSICGARILYIILYPHHFSSLRDYFALHEGGLVFYGGFITATTALFLFCSRIGISAGSLFSQLAPSIALGHALGRLGCLANHCCYGKPTDLIKIYHLPGDEAGVFRHPTQLYESLFNFMLALLLQFLLHWQKKRQEKYDNLPALIYIFSYTLFRFLVESLRGDDRGGFFTSFELSVSQLISLILFLTVPAIAMAGSFKHKSRYGADE